jgi:hypothetical protein
MTIEYGRGASQFQAEGGGRHGADGRGRGDGTGGLLFSMDIWMAIIAWQE